MTAVDLDALDKLREAALTIRQNYPSMPRIVQTETDIEAVWSDGGRSVLAECYGEDVAAWLAEAADALPDLIAEVRVLRRVREVREAWAAAHAHCACSSQHLLRELGWALDSAAVTTVDGGEGR